MLPVQWTTGREHSTLGDGHVPEELVQLCGGCDPPFVVADGQLDVARDNRRSRPGQIQGVTLAW